MNLTKVAIVTGATGGIGRATALRLAQDGMSVVVHCHSRETEARELLQALPGEDHLIVQADMANSDDALSLIEKTHEKYGRIDVLVNNAGIYEHHKIEELDYNNWQRAWNRTLQVNLLGPMNLVFGAVQHMIGKNPGKIINITSRGAFRGEPKAPAYGASKAALNSASQSLAKALASHGVMVYAIAPGWVDTDMAAAYLQGPLGNEIRSQSPLGRVADPEEIANLISFLAGEGTDYLTGAIIDANGASYLRT